MSIHDNHLLFQTIDAEEKILPQIELDHVTKIFTRERHKFPAIDDLSLSIEAGEFVFLVGSSGAGKTTLLRILANYITPEYGFVCVQGRELYRIRPWRRATYRRIVGQVWQEPSLIRKKTIGENLEIAQRAMGVPKKLILENTLKALSIVGMRNKIDCYPYMLSGGQIKMVELARAIINSPPILLLDEITANLDHDTGWDIMHILMEINRRGTTVVMATHARDFVNIMCRRVVTLASGHIAGDVAKGRYGEIR